MATQSKGKSKSGNPAKAAAASKDKEETIDPELQALIDIENANITAVQQAALIQHLQQRIVVLHKENLALRRQVADK